MASRRLGFPVGTVFVAFAMHASAAGFPLYFEPNLGQADAQVRFLAHGGGMTAFFTNTEAVMALGRGEAPVRMKLEGAAQPTQIAGLETLPGVSNYFIGNDPAKWRTDVPHFARLEYKEVYPGIDMAWYVDRQRLEYDFLVAPGTDPEQIQMTFQGVESVYIDKNGDLVLRTVLGDVITQQKPRVYQEAGGKQVEIAARYAIRQNRVSFALTGFDHTRALRIDPVVLVYSTYLGGNGQGQGAGIAVDAAGSAYITGFTTSANFPTQSPEQTNLKGSATAFVTKLTPSGNELVYSTYLGGSNYDASSAIAVDASGSAYLTGITDSSDFPTLSPYQSTLHGSSDAFVTKLTPAGNALAYSTYLGGSNYEAAYGIAVDAAGSAYVAGTTASSDFPTQSPFQAANEAQQDTVFVAKLTPAGNALAYSTYLGGSGGDSAYGIAVDGANSAYVIGSTASTDFPTQSPYQAALHGPLNVFVTKIAPAGNALLYSTYLGGSGSDSAGGIAVDQTGSAYVTGTAFSTDFPTQSPYQPTLLGTYNAFIAKLAPAGNALLYSTYLGGSGYDSSEGIAVDGAGSAYITGYTGSADFPTQSPYQSTLQGGGNVFLTKLAPSGAALAYSTYLGTGGDSGLAVAVDGNGSAYVTGTTASSTFPTQSAYESTLQGSSDTFVAKLAVPQTQQTITFSTLANQIFGAAPFTVSATASSGLAVSFASSTSGVCTVSGATVTLVAAGTCTVQATQAGSGMYVAAAPVSQSFQVTYSPCDLMQTGSVSVTDVQVIINEALGITPVTYDLSGTGVATVVDVQIEINAALGLGCAAQ